ncbi:hypothetical protein HZS_1766 [Henneguya salminicola]|nr:hypothetical protein HZS_1766 [Henneguya salminicola]
MYMNCCKKKFELIKKINVGYISKLFTHETDIFIYVRDSCKSYGILSIESDKPAKLYDYPYSGTITDMCITEYGLVCILDSGAILLGDLEIKNYNCPAVCEILYKHNQAVTSIAHEKNILVTGSKDCTACIFDLCKFLLIEKITFYSPIKMVSIGQKWIALATEHRSILLIDPAYKPITSLLGHGLYIQALKLNKTHVISVSENGSIYVYNTAELEIKLILDCINTKNIHNNDIHFLEDNSVIINDHSYRIRIVCLKKYHVLNILENKSEIIMFTIIGM